jgi:SAM-dependent methyltransferase
MNAGHSTSGLVAEGLVLDTTNPFALPVGVKGRLAGWYMGRPDGQHRELAAIAPLAGRTRLAEIGFGPGQMLEMLHRRMPGLELCGVDPSELMVRRARRRNLQADLHVGAAAAMPFPDGHADLILSVNNVPMWPDLDAALAEVSRVLRPGGIALIAWHGGHQPRGHQRRLVLAPDREEAVTAAIRRRFPTVTVSILQHSILWEATA